MQVIFYISLNYFRGLQNWTDNLGYLRNTCLAAQEIIMLNVKKEIYLVKNRRVCT